MIPGFLYCFRSQYSPGQHGRRLCILGALKINPTPMYGGGNLVNSELPSSSYVKIISDWTVNYLPSMIMYVKNAFLLKAFSTFGNSVLCVW